MMTVFTSIQFILSHIHVLSIMLPRIYENQTALQLKWTKSSVAVTHPKEKIIAIATLNGICTLGWQWLDHTESKEPCIKSYVIPQALHLRLQMKPSWVRETALFQRFHKTLMNHCWPNCSVSKIDYPRMLLGVFLY